jgi:hypothetical protein
MTDYYVYVLRDPRKDDEPFYVGKGRGNRHRHHFTKTHVKEENRHKTARIDAIEKAGLSVVVEKYRENLTEEEAYTVESELIQQWGRKSYDDNGVLTNVCVDNRPPNHTGMKRTDATRAKMRAAKLGISKSESHCQAISESKSGENHPRWGKNLDEDLKARIRAANINADSPIKKTNWEDVREIRLMHRLGQKPKVIQERFDYLSLATVRDIIAERTWKEEFRPRP